MVKRGKREEKLRLIFWEIYVGFNMVGGWIGFVCLGFVCIIFWNCMESLSKGG